MKTNYVIFGSIFLVVLVFFCFTHDHNTSLEPKAPTTSTSISMTATETDGEHTENPSTPSDYATPDCEYHRGT